MECQPQVLRRYFCENLQDTATSFFSCFTSVFISADIIFTTFQNFIQHYLKELFVPNFPFLMGSPPSPQPHHLNGQNLLNVTKVFCRFSLKCLLKYFFFPKIYWQNPEKHFLKVSTTDSLVICSKHSSTTAILTKASVITCKKNVQIFSCIGFTYLNFIISFFKD